MPSLTGLCQFLDPHEIQLDLQWMILNFKKARLACSLSYGVLLLIAFLKGSQARTVFLAVFRSSKKRRKSWTFKYRIYMAMVAVARAVSYLDTSRERREIGGPAYCHGVVAYMAKLHILNSPAIRGSTVILRIAADDKHTYSIRPYDDTTAEAIAPFIDYDLHQVLREVIYNERLRTLPAYRSADAQIQDAVAVAGVTGAQAPGYSRDWVARMFLIPVMRTMHGVNRLQLAPSDLASDLPGPDKNGARRELAKKSKFAAEVLRMVAYRRPAELFCCDYCLSGRKTSSLTVSPHPKQEKAAARSAKQKKQRIKQRNLAVLWQKRQEIGFMRICGGCGKRGIHYLRREVADKGEARKCMHCHKRCRPSGGDVKEIRPPFSPTSIDEIPKSGNTTCGTCGHRTLWYSAGVDKSHPRFCVVCRTKRRCL